MSSQVTYEWCLRRRAAEGRRTGRSLIATSLVASVLVALTASPTDLSAGSVFMKNGYIIQGPIVDRADDSIVLGWPNGKVTIAQRFIESISYDPGEEKRLEEEANYHKQVQELGVEEDPSLLATSTDIPELPGTLEELMQKFGPAATKSPADPAAAVPGGVLGSGVGAVGPDGGATEQPGTDGAVTTPEVVVRPEEKLGMVVRDEARELEIRPPQDWTVNSAGSAFVAAGPAGADGFRPSINVVMLSRGGVSPEEYATFLKQENAALLTGFEILQEGPREIGARKVYQLVGRGVYQGRAAVVHQILAVDEDRVWLLSAFTGERDEVGHAAVIEESIRTADFLSK